MTIVGLLQNSSREIQFDLSARAKYLDPERMERTVYVSPLAANITPEMVKVSNKRKKKQLLITKKNLSLPVENVLQ